MEDLIKLECFPIKSTIKILLKDKTTKKNIIWATSSYEDFGEQYIDDKEITIEALTGLDSIELQPRIMKDLDKQQERTRNHAEVFTPSWICNQMNNYCDEMWFGRKNIFNTQDGQAWKTNEEKISFPKKKDWKHYVDSRRLEITCGEAPFIVSRYDASNGKLIDIKDRIGIIDRKLRIVNENAETEEEWLKWTIRAFQSVYGYEYQGDNLLIARINLLLTFTDYLNYRWHRQATASELRKVANIISWNIWQMDALTGTIPFGEIEENVQYSLFDLIEDEHKNITPKCRIYDWRAERSILYESIKTSQGTYSAKKKELITTNI